MTLSRRLRPTEAKNAAAARGVPASTDASPSSAIGRGRAAWSGHRNAETNCLPGPTSGASRRRSCARCSTFVASAKRSCCSERRRAPGGRDHQSELARAQAQEPVLVPVVEPNRDGGERPGDDDPGEQRLHPPAGSRCVLRRSRRHAPGLAAPAWLPAPRTPAAPVSTLARLLLPKTMARDHAEVAIESRTCCTTPRSSGSHDFFASGAPIPDAGMVGRSAPWNTRVDRTNVGAPDDPHSGSTCRSHDDGRALGALGAPPA